MEAAMMDWMFWINVATGVIAVATVVTAATKSTWDNKIVQVLSDVVNMIAGNFGKNKNADR